MDACPDFIGVVKIFAFLELESRYSGKHFSKVSAKSAYSVVKFGEALFLLKIESFVLRVQVIAGTILNSLNTKFLLFMVEYLIIFINPRPLSVVRVNWLCRVLVVNRIA
jgi:hypothetical protein